MIWNLLSVLIGLGLIAWGGNWVWVWLKKRRLRAIGGEISAVEFEETMRKAQIIDLREKKDFDANRVLGARNLPYTQLTTRYAEMRKDLPVYLYDETGALSIRAAGKMKKQGFQHVYWLKGGFRDWSGKTKKGAKY